MISIKRPPTPEFLLDPLKKWEKEKQSAINHYANGSTSTSFEFETYNDSMLKDELKKFFTKCAYCESSYGAVYDGDIEHFRPKGKVNEKSPQTPGYYWLANDWDNLLLACQHCNQRRNHLLDGETSLKGLGKLDQFPLSDETKRVSTHLELLDEEEKVRLLLNPCKDRPEEHFEYENTEAVIRPITKKGESSVRVYALQRPLLVQERKKRLKQLFHQMDIVKRELERFNVDGSDIQKKLFARELDFLLNFTKSESIYAGMCRYFVKSFFSENGIT
jgi:5-methylcytosine-specific restriction endonuclease McrA